MRVPFERGFELFDRVQARLRAGDLRGDLAVAALQVGHALGDGVAVLARDARALALRRRFGFVARDEDLALAEPRARLVGGVRVLVAFRQRARVLALEPLDLAARGVDLRAPLRLARGALGRERLDRAQLLVHRVERAARGGDRFGRRELALARAVGLRVERREPFLERADRVAQRLALALDAVAVGDDGVGLPLEPVAPRDRGGQIGFDARELRARGLRARAVVVQLQLDRVRRVAQRRERRAELRRARGRGGGPVLVLLQLRRDALALGAARRRRAQVRQDLEVAHARGHLAVAFRAAHLRVELRHAPFQLGDEVVDADRVLLGGFQPAQRLVLAREELADAGGLFEQRAALGGLRRQDRVDLALRHDRVRARPQARAHQQLVHVAQAHGLAVDVELGLADAVRAPRDLHLGEVERQHALRVVERERHLGHAERLARVVAGEDDVFHLLRAQAARRLLAEHPADRVDEVGLAGAVGADDRRGAVDEIERRRFGERLEAEDLERFQTHSG